MRKHTGQRSPLLLMALTILLDFTGFGLILPLLPFWAQRLGASAVGVGLLLTIYALAQFVFTPVLGALSDRYGRRPIIIASLCIEAISLVLTALAGSLPVLLFARLVGGLGASNIGSAQAVVSDVTPAKDRAKGMGLIGASIGMGFVIGPALGGVLAPLGETVPFWITAALALLNALLVVLFLPETRKPRTEEVPRRAGGPRVLLVGWRHLHGNRALIAFVIVNLLFTVAFTGMETVLPLFTQHLFGWGTVQNGYLFTYVGVVMVLMQGGLVRQLVKVWREQAILFVGLLLLAVGLVLTALSSQLAWLFIALGVLSVGEGAVTPTITTLVSFVSGANAQGETLGLFQAIGGLGRVVGPLLAAALYGRISPAAPLITGGIVVVLAALIVLPILPTIPRPEQGMMELTEPLSVGE